MKFQSRIKTTAVLFFSGSMFLTGCATLFSTKEAPVVLVDAPADLKVSENGSRLEIVEVISSRTEGNNSSTLFLAPGVKLDKKVKRHTLTLSSGGVSKDTEVALKASGGMIFLDIMFTGPIGIVVDASTKKWRKAKKRHIDVPAVLNGTEPRSQGKLKRTIRRQAR